MQGIGYLSAGLCAGLAFMIYLRAFTEEQLKFALAIAGLGMCAAANASMMGIRNALGLP